MQLNMFRPFVNYKKLRTKYYNSYNSPVKSERRMNSKKQIIEISIKNSLEKEIKNIINQ